MGFHYILNPPRTNVLPQWFRIIHVSNQIDEYMYVHGEHHEIVDL